MPIMGLDEVVAAEMPKDTEENLRRLRGGPQWDEAIERRELRERAIMVAVQITHQPDELFQLAAQVVHWIDGAEWPSGSTCRHCGWDRPWRGPDGEPVHTPSSTRGYL